jgi:hypothetical protein
MALCGRNMSLNLYENMDYVEIPPKICEAALKTVLCVCVCVCM